MKKTTRDPANINLINKLISSFDNISTISLDKALNQEVSFNSTNMRAKQAYKFGRMFISNLNATFVSGTTSVYSMLFDMNKVFENFIYKATSFVFGKAITYQKTDNYLLSSDEETKGYIRLRPDLTLKISENEQWIIDTKWKIPKGFAKESDCYQMAAYASTINNTSKVILLFPHYSTTEKIIGKYKFNFSEKNESILEIKTIDLKNTLNWHQFLSNLKNCLIN